MYRFGVCLVLPRGAGNGAALMLRLDQWSRDVGQGWFGIGIRSELLERLEGKTRQGISYPIIGSCDVGDSNVEIIVGSCEVKCTD